MVSGRCCSRATGRERGRGAPRCRRRAGPPSHTNRRGSGRGCGQEWRVGGGAGAGGRCGRAGARRLRRGRGGAGRGHDDGSGGRRRGCRIYRNLDGGWLRERGAERGRVWCRVYERDRGGDGAGTGGEAAQVSKTETRNRHPTPEPWKPEGAAGEAAQHTCMHAYKHTRMRRFRQEMEAARTAAAQEAQRRERQKARASAKREQRLAEERQRHACASGSDDDALGEMDPNYVDWLNTPASPEADKLRQRPRSKSRGRVPEARESPPVGGGGAGGGGGGRRGRGKSAGRSAKERGDKEDCWKRRKLQRICCKK